MDGLIKDFYVDKLHVLIYETRQQMGQAASSYYLQRLKTILDRQPTARAVFAAAHSQDEFLEGIRNAGKEIFGRVEAFHMDEYIGLPADAPQRFGNFLSNAIFNRAPFKAVHLMDSGGQEGRQECLRYGKLIESAPLDIVSLGIGENGHIAFNEPFSSLNSRTRMKTLTQDTIQVNSRFFGGDVTLVPKTALTVGVGTVLSAKKVLILATGHKKARVEGAYNHQWTISALQVHPNGILVCDDPAAEELRVSTYRYFKDIERDNLISK